MHLSLSRCIPFVHTVPSCAICKSCTKRWSGTRERIEVARNKREIVIRVSFMIFKLKIFLDFFFFSWVVIKLFIFLKLN